jgi:threonine/homoserine/homoserine lactone efflux protein
MELGIHDPWLFVAAALALNVTPGPDSAYVVASSLRLGWRGGVAAALGVGAGCLLHILAAAVGLSALLAASATAFLLIKVVGAVYLCAIGLQLLLTRSAGAAPVEPAPGAASLAAVFRRGALTNALNPKVALFFLAFLPQFVDAEAPAKGLAFLLLGLFFDVTGTLWNLGLALVAAQAAARLRAARRLSAWIQRALGAMFLGLGLRVAFLQVR